MASYDNYANGNGTYGGSSYGASYNNYAATYGGGATSSSNPADGGLRRRTTAATPLYGNASGEDSNGKSKGPSRAVVERLDILFPKVDREFLVKTKGGGIVSMIAYILIGVLCLAEVITWLSQNQADISNTFVDTSLGKQMRVNLNITFPALACEDLHLDIIDIAGDSQLDIEDTLVKKKLHTDGRPFSVEEIDVEINQHRQMQDQKEKILKQDLPEDYCGPCYGSQERDDQCCQTCDEVLLAYSKKRWKSELLRYTAEQCIREGRDKAEPKKMTIGQGCNLSGYMMLNRVSGNFHIAMGEGIERDGRHIHTYLPEDAPNFNASHVINELSFGPPDGSEPLSGAVKIVTEDTGTTGLFQYFIKVVPTTFVGERAIPPAAKEAGILPSEADFVGKERAVETNRYFVTERFMPLMTELLEDHHKDEEDPRRAAVHAGHSGGHHSQHHHSKQNAVLPGVFFIYEIYPFAVEVRRNRVPVSHLFIRLLATIGGVVTILKWFDSWLYDRGNRKMHDPR